MLNAHQIARLGALVLAVACLVLAAACQEPTMVSAGARPAAAPTTDISVGRDHPASISKENRNVGRSRSQPESTRRRLERAAKGLLYTSESDYPFVYYRSSTPISLPLDAAAFRLAIGLAADASVEEVSLDDFFARHIESVDPNDEVAVRLVPRYRRLKETIRRAVDGPRVYRVGQIQVQCYLVGTDGEGKLVGLTTVAIET